MSLFLIGLGVVCFYHLGGFYPEQASAAEGKTGSVWHVAIDGTGQFVSIQEAIDQASSGDTILIKAGTYAEDVTVHSKERFSIIGEGMDQVFLTGEKRVGTLHIGKWPYGAINVKIEQLSVIQHGGLGVGIFNGSGVHLKHVRVKGMVFAQEVKEVTLEECIIGESETTGVAFSASTGTLIGNRIHHNDHGVVIGGHSQVRLNQNIITQNLFEAVLITDQSQGTLIQNTLVRNGGGAAFQDETHAEVRGNIISHSKVGLLFNPKSQTQLAFNALHGNKGNYMLTGTPPTPTKDRAGATDVTLAPGFVNVEEGDFRLRPDSSLLKIGEFSYLGALPPVSSNP